MLTRLKVRNFKPLKEVDIELGKTVVFVGPNNSGKTTALQALAIWQLGLRRWLEKRTEKTAPEKRPGVAVNRKDLIAVPVPGAKQLWKNLKVRDVQRTEGKQETKNIRIDIVVSGISDGKQWECGLEFDFSNEESVYCRPLRLGGETQVERMVIPEAAEKVRVAFLPPMSGLTTREERLERGAINVRIGEGRTAEVLRNLCYRIYDEQGAEVWGEVVSHIERLFGARLNKPHFWSERGEIVLTYRERWGTELDISSSGRGLQQTLLLLAYLYANPEAVLLVDEPDAHLEILRQRQTYALLSEVAERRGSQVIIATHSEVVLNEAAGRDMVIAFVGRPHRIDDRGTQVLKALKDIPCDHYHLAEQVGWVIYLEGSNDLAILQAFAKKLRHPAAKYLNQPFVHYVENKPERAREHFYGLREAKNDLVGVALFDRLNEPLQSREGLTELRWNQREIENYLCFRETLRGYAESGVSEGKPEPLFEEARRNRQRTAMEEAIEEVASDLRTKRKGEPFSADIKASDEFLDPVFEAYFEKLGLPNILRKTHYYVLVPFVPEHLISREVTEKLDAIVEVAQMARPLGDEE